MRKFILFMCFFKLVFIGLQNGFAQETITLDKAIKNSVDYLAPIISQERSVAITSFSSPEINLSKYIINNMLGRLDSKKRFTLVSRDEKDLEAVFKELGLSMTGAISIETAQSVGRKIGAQTVFLGSIDEVGNIYQFSVRAIAVETAVIQGIYSVNVSKKSVEKLLTHKTDKIKPDASYSSWAPKYAKRNIIPFLIVGPLYSIELDGKDTSFRMDWSFHHSFLPFTSVGISGVLALGLVDVDDSVIRFGGVAGTVGLVLPINHIVNLFGDGLVEMGSGRDKGTHFGYSTGISIKIEDWLGIEINHKGIFYGDRNLYTVGLGFCHFF